MLSRRLRLTVVMTHPVQYYSPWFRYIDREAEGLDLRVLYVSEPTPRQQGTGFGESFEWDVPLREGYESEVLRAPRASDRFESERFFGLDAPGIGEAIERDEPDAVLIMGWHCLALVRAILACRRRGIPLLYRGDTTGPGPKGPVSRGLWRLRTRWLLSRFDAHLAVGARAREHLASFQISGDRIFFSPHAVDNAFFARTAKPYQEPAARESERRKLEVGADDLLVLFVGKLEPIKRVDDANRALGDLARAHLLVVGTGSERERHERLAAGLGVSVRWRGFTNQSELGTYYAVADCLVLSSTSETWGLVVNEAMATGLPCVVSDGVGCAPDLVERGRTGEVFPVGDVPALSKALRKLQDEKQRGACRREACLDKIAAHDFAAATEGLFAACRAVVQRG